MDDFANWIIEPAASIVNAAWHMAIKPGDRVLLIGAGFMGLMMIQLVSRYSLAEFVACDVKLSSCKMAEECGSWETILISLVGTERPEKLTSSWDISADRD